MIVAPGGGSPNTIIDTFNATVNHINHPWCRPGFIHSFIGGSQWPGLSSFENLLLDRKWLTLIKRFIDGSKVVMIFQWVNRPFYITWESKTYSLQRSSNTAYHWTCPVDFRQVQWIILIYLEFSPVKLQSIVFWENTGPKSLAQIWLFRTCWVGLSLN